MQQREVVIVAATRTPVGSFHGALAPLTAVELGTAAVQGLLAQSGVAPQQIDEVILGQVLTAGCGQNPARQTALNAGLPVTTPALTINKVCGSGLKAVHLAVQAIRSGDADAVIAGGPPSRLSSRLAAVLSLRCSAAWHSSSSVISVPARGPLTGELATTLAGSTNSVASRVNSPRPTC